MKKCIWTLLSDGLLLLCALVGFVGCFLTLYPDIPYLSACSFRLTVYSAVFALLSLLLWSLPKYRIPVLLFLLIGMAAAGFYFQLYLSDGAQLVLEAIFEQVYPKFELTLRLFLIPIDWDRSVFLFLSFALALIALLLGWNVVRARRWWVSVLLTLLPILPALLCEGIPHPLALTLLFGSLSTMLFLSLSRKASPPRRGKLSLILLPSVCAVVGTLLILCPQESYQRPNWSTQAQIRLYDFTDRYLPFLSQSDLGTSVSASGARQTVDLAKEGPRNYLGRTVLQVKTNYVGTVYIRGNSYAVYEDNQWKAVDTDDYRNFYNSLTAAEKLQYPLSFPAAVCNPTELYEIAIRNMGLSGNFIYQPYGITNWSGYAFTPIQDSGFRSPSDLRYHTYSCSVGLWDLSSVTTSSAPEPELRSAMEKYEAFVYEQYTDVEISPTLERWINGKLSAGWGDDFLISGTVYHTIGGAISELSPDLSEDAKYYLSCARKVAFVLAQNFRYDLNTRAIPEDTDFVEYFLLSSRKGYCVHFASAATVMLRYMGVPARYVSGFTVKTSANTTTTNVLDEDAHAWVEIYLSGYGWYPMEVTPGFYGVEEELPGDEPSPTETTEPEPSDEPEPSLTPPPSELPTDEPTPSQRPGTDPSHSPSPSTQPGTAGSSQLLQTLLRISKWTLMAAGMILALIVVQWLPKCIRRKRLRSSNTNRAVLYAYRYLLRLTRWGGTVHPYALELARKAKFSSHTLTPEEQAWMNALFDGERRRIGEELPSGRRLVFRCLWGIPKEQKTTPQIRIIGTVGSIIFVYR